MSNVIKSVGERTLSTESRPIEIKTISLPKKEKGAEKRQDEKENQRLETHLKEREQRLQQKEKEMEKRLRAAEEELQLAREKIKKEEQEAEKKLQVAFQQAEETGYQAGFEKGVQDGFLSYEQKINEAKEVIQTAKNDYHLYLEKAEPVILELALAIAKRIVHHELQDEDKWMQLVKEAVQEVKEQKEVAIYVAPTQYPLLKNRQQEMESILPYAKELIILPDAELTDNACFIETPYGRIDASVDSQLEELKRQLHERLKEGEKDESS